MKSKEKIVEKASIEKTNVEENPAAKPTRSLAELEAMAKETEDKYGELIEEGKYPNPMALAYLVSLVFGKIVYVGSEDRIYRRDGGLYTNLPEDLFANEIIDFLLTFFRQQRGGLAVCHKFNTSLINEILRLIKGFCRDDHFFDRTPGVVILHLQNCFLVRRLGDKGFEQLPLDTEWIHSRNQINAAYDPKAKADRFMGELLMPVLDADEIEVLLQYAAQVLLGENIAEKILVISGLAGAGKSVVVNILEDIIGKQNVTQLRTECLHGWYESNRYIGKSLLVGKDVPPNFLRNRGASQLKALTGKDRINTEAKHSNAVGEIEGKFNVIITSNSNQPLLLQDDRDAWARRMLTITFKGKPPKNPIPKFDELLLREERSGIINEILRRLEAILANGGKIEPSEAQKRAIADLLDESESERVFLQERVEAVDVPDGASQRRCKENLTSEELYLAYLDYCASRKWTPVPTRKFQQSTVDLMPRLFQRFRRNDIVRNGTNHRGYYAVRFK